MAEFSDREQCERRAESESISELRKLENSQATGFALGSIKALLLVCEEKKHLN